MRKKTPKALIRLNGRPMFEYSLEAVSRVKAISKIIIALPASLSSARLRRINTALSRFKNAKAVAGGKERYDSVKNALAAADEPDFILIHDCARPLIRSDFIEQMLKSAFKNGSCVAGRMLNESIKKLRGNRLVKNLSRDGIFIAETPQIFRADMFIKCMRKLRIDSKIVTDDSFIPLKKGCPVYYMITDFNNIKVTTANDLRLAEILLKAH